VLWNKASLVVPARACPGHTTSSGSRVPPSYSEAFPLRHGWLLVAGTSVWPGGSDARGW